VNCFKLSAIFTSKQLYLDQWKKKLSTGKIDFPPFQSQLSCINDGGTYLGFVWDLLLGFVFPLLNWFVWTIRFLPTETCSGVLYIDLPRLLLYCEFRDTSRYLDS
jgi:hypothetical protein